DGFALDTIGNVTLDEYEKATLDKEFLKGCSEFYTDMRCENFPQTTHWGEDLRAKEQKKFR
uniref:MHC class II antigen beta chain n=1 Tax=Romanomermis culicivorax TaxID=13658 RepID=A0A915KM52_ROMCU